MDLISLKSAKIKSDVLDTNTKMRDDKLPIFLFSLATLFLFADQNLLAPNLSKIADEFGFTDEERDSKLGGEISLAFFALGAPISFVVGWGADRYNRILIFVWVIIFGEGACAATYWTTTYEGLFWTRALTGISVGGALPLVFSILSDMVADDRRNVVAAAVGGGMGLGIAFGQILAGALSADYDWRLPFLVVSLPSFVVALLLYMIFSDPPRGGMEKATRNKMIALESQSPSDSDKKISDTESANEDDDVDDDGDKDTAQVITPAAVVYRNKANMQSFKELFQNPSAILCFLQGVPGCLPWGLILVFLNDYLSNEGGQTVESATFLLSLLGAGALFGTVFGGWFGQKLKNKYDSRIVVLYIGTAGIIGCIPFWLLLNTTTTDSVYAVAALYALLTGFFASMTGPNVKAILANTTLPEQRGTAFAALNTTDDLGRGFGPYLVSVIISISGGDRATAFNLIVGGWFVGSMCNLCLFFTVIEGETTTQELVEKAIGGGEGDTVSQ